jgi:FKBP-type peptidyl-prolyl cis-trans isomerase SlpA
MTDEITVQPGCEVVLHCSITLEDGTVAENTFEEEPIRVVMGEDDVLIKTLQMALYGTKVGDRDSLMVDPENAFGLRDEGAIHTMPRSDFPEEMELEVGQIIAFSTPTGDEIPGAIIELDENNAQVDFNHPLAGREIKFEFEILEIHPPKE